MLISIVVPVYNEQDVLPHFFKSLAIVLDRVDHDYEVIVVNDGSRDATFEVAGKYSAFDKRIKLVGLSRNFGQQAAMTAGLDCSRGDVVVVMDADLQDPPELLEQMLEKYREGYDVVSCQRISRAGETWFKKTTASLFYELMRRAIDSRIPAEVGDFRLYSRNAVDAICAFREQHRFMRGLVAWLGLREAFIPFHRPARVAGETKYPLSKLIKLAWTAISSSTGMPLKASSYAGFGLLFLAAALVLLMPLASMEWISVTVATLGWMSLQIGLTGLQLAAIGIAGDYIARIYEESKQRPLYIVSSTVNLDHPHHASRAYWTSESEFGQPQRDGTIDQGARTRPSHHSRRAA